MTQAVRIDADPTYWHLAGELSEQQLAAATEPLQLDITSPLPGRLLLAPRRAAAVELLDEFRAVGVHGSDALLPAQPVRPAPLPLLYVPSAAGLTPQSRMFLLPPGTDPGELAAAIAAAMTSGSVLTQPIVDGGIPSILMLNGANLAFAVIGQAAA